MRNVIVVADWFEEDEFNEFFKEHRDIILMIVDVKNGRMIDIR